MPQTEPLKSFGVGAASAWAAPRGGRAARKDACRAASAGEVVVLPENNLTRALFTEMRDKTCWMG